MTQTLSAPKKVLAQPQYRITQDDRGRQKKIAEAWQAYNGELTPPLQKMPNGTDPNVMSNQCVGVVDGGTNFLFTQELEISIEESGPAEAQTLIDNTWGRKEKRIPLLLDLATNGALAGTSFLRIVPAAKKTYRLVVIDPATVFVRTAPQDCETVLLYCIEYSAEEDVNGKSALVYYREEISRIDPLADDTNQDTAQSIDTNDYDADVTWSIQHWTRVGTAVQWVPAGQPIDWKYPFAPLFHCKNLPNPNSFWGRPDITQDIIGLNKSLNLTLSLLQLLQILYGQPVLYTNGVGDQSVIDLKPGKIIGLPSDTGKISSVSIVSDIPSALAFIADQRSSIDEQTSVPGVAIGRIKDMPRGNLSGVAIELLFMSLLKKTDKKRMLYGELIIDVSKALFVLAGLSGDIDVTLAWQDPLPKEDLASAQYAVALKGLGISDTTLQRQLGFDPEEEFELSQTEDTKKIAKMQAMGLSPNPPGLSPTQPPTQPQPGQTAQVPAPASPFIGGDKVA